MEVETGIEGMAFGWQRAFNYFEKTEFELRMDVRENLLGLFLAALNHSVAAILERSQFVQSVFPREPAAKVGAAFIGLKSRRD